MNFQTMLKKAAPLTIKQHGILRDAGFAADVVSKLSKPDYQRIRESIQYEHRTDPAIKTQVEYLESLAGFDYEVPANATFEMCRFVIRQHEKEHGDDQKYQAYIASYEADCAARAERKRKAKGRGQQVTIDPVDEVEDPRYFNGSDEDDEVDTSFDHDLYARLHTAASGADTFMQRLEHKRQQKFG